MILWEKEQLQDLTGVTEKGHALGVDFPEDKSWAGPKGGWESPDMGRGIELELSELGVCGEEKGRSG